MDPRDTRRPRRAAQKRRRRRSGGARAGYRRAAGGGHGRAAPQPRARRLRDQPGTSGRQEGRRQPRELAGWLAEALAAADGIASAEVAGPGFVNLRLEASAQGVIVSNIVTAGAGYGRSGLLGGQKINLEFVSANPTGPIHIGGTRWAAVGDALGRLLSTQGAEVVREYYFNDHGAQIDRFVNSLIAAANGQPAPRTATPAPTSPTSPPRCWPGPRRARFARRRAARDLPLHRRRPDVHPYQGLAARVRHRLRRLHPRRLHAHQRAGRPGDRQAPRDRQHLREKDGATWLRTTEFGDDKDRVVIKSDGQPAYIAGDLAYYLDKRQRGFDLCIYMLGADHHGYIARLKAAAAAGLGDDPDTVEVLIGQMVNLVRDGQPVRMSKRAGTVITLDDLVEAIGVDAARYALTRSSVDTPIDIDLQLWSSAPARTRSTTCNTPMPGSRRWPATPPTSALQPTPRTSTCSPTTKRAPDPQPRGVLPGAADRGDPARTAPGLPLPRGPRR